MLSQIIYLEPCKSKILVGFTCVVMQLGEVFFCTVCLAACLFFCSFYFTHKVATLFSQGLVEVRENFTGFLHKELLWTLNSMVASQL